MSKLMNRFWNDDEGAIISVELILVLTVLIFGIIPGLAALRNGVVAALTNLANEVAGVAIVNVTVDGIGVGPVAGGTSGVAGVGMFQITTPAQTDILLTSGIDGTIAGSPHVYGPTQSAQLSPINLITYP